MVQYIHSGSRYLVNKEATLQKLGANISLEDVRHLPLREIDRVAQEFAQSRKRLATAQGATTGFGGIFHINN
ncbi:hypothetical protein GCM10020331_076400 [Ectobacillus funiculus]